MNRFQMLLALVACVPLVGLSGCGGAKVEETVEVRGKLVNQGQPVHSEGDTPLMLNFHLLGEGGKVEQSYLEVVVEDDGTFRTELKPGKYKVELSYPEEVAMMKSMQQRAEQPEGEENPEAISTPAPFGGKYTLANTPIEITVSEATELVIDLSKY